MSESLHGLSAASLDRYDALLHAIYAAALEPQRWPSVVEQIAIQWAAPRALLYSFSLASGAVGFSFAHNISARELQIYAARSTTTDPFVEAARHRGLLTEGCALVGHELVPMTALVTTAFYRDIWQPLGIAHLCTGVVFDGSDSYQAPTVISLYRTIDDPPFTETDRSLLQRLVAHLSRSLGVMRHLRDRELTITATAAAFDGLPHGVVLLSQALHVLHLNTAAHAMVQRQSVICLARTDHSQGTGETLALPRSLQHLQPRFDAWLRSAWPIDMRQEVAHFSSAFVLLGEQGEPRCVLHAAPLLAHSDAWTFAGSLPRVVVMAYDLADVHIEPQQLCHLFGLTPAEALAALQVLRGGSVAEMAARLQVSANTFKTQLAAAYAKTMTHRQTDLLKLLLSLSANPAAATGRTPAAAGGLIGP